MLQKILLGSSVSLFLVTLFVFEKNFYSQRETSKNHALVETPSIESCTSCHQGSLLPNHTPVFVQRFHGFVAQKDRDSCFNCHRQETCQSCHLEKKPRWHQDDFCQPAFSISHRNAHIKIASYHRTSCLECHQTTFQKQCASCHLFSEGNLWSRFPDLSSKKNLKFKESLLLK